jgi:large subunit ribosomal protein L15
MDLSNLKPAKGATKKRKRIGRGVGSGKGGHSATRGNKGQNSVSGGGVPAHFEGGQMPLQRRIPKYGFTNKRFRVSYRGVNLSSLARLVEEGRIDPAQPLTPEAIVDAGLARKNELIKILGGGDLNVALNVTAHAFSASAMQKLQESGGSATVAQ